MYTGIIWRFNWWYPLKKSGSIFKCSNQFQPVDEQNILPFQLVIEMDFGRQLLKGPVFRRKESAIFFQVLFWYS